MTTTSVEEPDLSQPSKLLIYIYIYIYIYILAETRHIIIIIIMIIIIIAIIILYRDFRGPLLRGLLITSLCILV